MDSPTSFFPLKCTTLKQPFQTISCTNTAYLDKSCKITEQQILYKLKKPNNNNKVTKRDSEW